MVDLEAPTVVCLVKLTNIRDANGNKLHTSIVPVIIHWRFVVIFFMNYLLYLTLENFEVVRFG